MFGSYDIPCDIVRYSLACDIPAMRRDAVYDIPVRYCTIFRWSDIQSDIPIFNPIFRFSVRCSAIFRCSNTSRIFECFHFVINGTTVVSKRPLLNRTY